MKKIVLFLSLISTPAISSSIVYIDQVGSGNNINIQQSDNDGKTAVIVNQGDDNNISVTQQGSGIHGAFIGNINTGNNNSTNTFTINQSGDGNHTASITLDPDYSNNNNTASVTQSGSANKSFTLNLSGSGIDTTVVQDNPTTADSGSMSIQCLTPPCIGYSYVRH